MSLEQRRDGQVAVVESVHDHHLRRRWRPDQAQAAAGPAAATGYERLLYDSMTGDMTLFHRSDLVEASWTIATPILDVWHTLPPRDFPNYVAGSHGPASADDLVQRDGHRW